MAIDFEKAFDSLEWDFLLTSLSKFEFGPSLQNWIRTLYSNPSSCVMNRGQSTGYFDIKRGVRQGDPLSPALFIIALEVLLVSIQQSNAINGIKVWGEDIKNSAFADDLTCFLADETSASNLLALLFRSFNK